VSISPNESPARPSGLLGGMQTEKLSQEDTMGERKGLRHLCAIVVAAAIWASMALFAAGCNMSQTPNRQLSDSQITTQVKAKLASDVRASSLTNIEVNTTNGIVTLTGQVENADVKNSAQTVTASVQGVLQINNNLQVAPAAASVDR
jgi:osmotically-inducible protein OsmY